jgi:hypothetical protein
MAGPEDKYSMNGSIRCEILERWDDPEGHDLARVTTEQPDYVETKDGVMRFVVLSSQVISAEETIAETERKAQVVKIAPSRSQFERINYCAQRQAAVNGSRASSAAIGDEGVMGIFRQLTEPDCCRGRERFTTLRLSLPNVKVSSSEEVKTGIPSL